MILPTSPRSCQAVRVTKQPAKADEALVQRQYLIRILPILQETIHSLDQKSPGDAVPIRKNPWIWNQEIEVESASSITRSDLLGILWFRLFTALGPAGWEAFAPVPKGSELSPGTQRGSHWSSGCSLPWALLGYSCAGTGKQRGIIILSKAIDPEHHEEEAFWYPVETRKNVWAWVTQWGHLLVLLSPHEWKHTRSLGERSSYFIWSQVF